MKLPSKRPEHSLRSDIGLDREEDRVAPGKLSLSGLRDGVATVVSSRAAPGRTPPPLPGMPVHRKTDGRRIASDARERVDAAAGQAGRPLPEALRAELERALNADLGGVKIHTGSVSASAARAVGARAYATGDDIHFAPGQFDPSSADGRQLIAHEVAHTVQSSSTSAPTRISEPGDAHERAADDFATSFGSSLASDGPVALPAAPVGVLHREEEPAEEGERDEGPDHEEQLREIQGMQMSSLLPAIAALPTEVRTDYDAAHVGGPRLKAAMYAVNDGGDWKSYITAHNDVAGHLPADQLDAIMDHLGGHSGTFRFYKDVGNFDGSVEPGGLVTLYFRVNFWVTEGTNLSGLQLENPDGRPTGWWDRTLEMVNEFGVEFKRVAEAAWSNKATIECTSSNVAPLGTRVQISVVDTGYHARIQLVPGARSQMHGVGSKTGTWSIGDNVERPTQDGHHQTTSVHEFGHAIGVRHPDTEHELIERYKNAKTAAERKKAEKALYAWQALKDKDSAQYGDNHAEKDHIMGRGDKLVALQGPDSFDPFTPFQEIAKKWGEEFIVAPAVNEWSTAGGG